MSALQPILFVDRDGTLIEEPADHQIDAYAKLRFVPGAIPAMLRLRDAGYQFVMVSNQDGLGTASFPQADFDAPHQLMMQVFESQGIVFREVLIDGSLPAENAVTRKPGIGMVLHYLKDRGIDWARSAMVGDRETDNLFAQNLGVRAFQLRTGEFGGDWDWAGIAHALVDVPRTASVRRKTKETDVQVEIDLVGRVDRSSRRVLFFRTTCLEQVGKHGGSRSRDLQGDLPLDEHHTVEDRRARGWPSPARGGRRQRGMARYGFTLPMDETLASAALDFSGRACLLFEGAFKRERVGDLPTELVPHFFRSLCDGAGLNLHLRVQGDNDHHQVEACFKVVARALRQSLRREGDALPSTKGML